MIAWLFTIFLDSGTQYGNMPTDAPDLEGAMLVLVVILLVDAFEVAHISLRCGGIVGVCL